VDLDAGRVKWQVPLGSLPPLDNVSGSRQWGSFALGGALLTSSGLVFIAGTFDQHLRALDVTTGKELWSASLPAAGNALPMTYVVDGRQYVVIAAGGHDRLHTTMGDYVVAFTLPGNGAPLPDTTAGGRQLDGNWAGEMRAGGGRFIMNVALHDGATTPMATVRIDSLEITSPVSASRTGRAVRLSFPFRYQPKNNCTGNIAVTLALWNGATLLEGGGTIDGPCAERGHQNASFVLRRR
jgi:hypothetical protein